MALSFEQTIGAWLMFAAGCVAAGFVLTVGFALWTYTEGRRVERGSSHGAGTCLRRGKGLSRRTLDDHSRAFLLGEITLDEMRRHYERSKA